VKRLQEKPATKNNSKKQYPKGNSKIQVVEKVNLISVKAANPNRENGVRSYARNAQKRH
jgi:hypothetical protein